MHKMPELEVFLKEKTEEILTQMGLPAGISVKLSAEQALVEITPQKEEDTPLLIGFHGQTLDALQTILRAVVFRNLGKAPAVSVEAGDYRKQREEELRRRALEAADKARFLLKEVSFPAMPPHERRLIHITLSEEKGVRTESRGERRERHVVVVPEGGSKA
ncbi:MAG: hypothetical protein BMS9Abin34_419 [Patescibacteria group bacterium]|nr:MAG: hypothetical protein BMS9Abin34_419 [Patescibacteria group bacterium]